MRRGGSLPPLLLCPGTATSTETMRVELGGTTLYHPALGRSLDVEGGEHDLSAWARFGGVLFRVRSVTPVLLVLVVIVWPTTGGLSPWRAVVALALVVGGEWYRMRAVGVAGKCTRTRGSNVKELVTSGPFAHVRNPLYIGNFLLAYGLVVLSKVDWLLWVFPLAFFFQYSAIVAWEEAVLRQTFGEEYERYRREVPAWLPTPRAYSDPSTHVYKREIAVRSERDSLRAVIVIAAILVLKHFVFHDAMSKMLVALVGPTG